MSERVESIRADARLWMAEHELLAESYWGSGRHARWLIGRPGRSEHRVEVIGADCGALIAHGDWDTKRFAYCRDSAWRKLLWMADHTSLDYVAEKAVIGMGGDMSAAWEYIPEEAKRRLAELVAEYREDGSDRAADDLQRAIDGHRYESDHELYGYLHDCDGDLWEHRFHVYDTHLLMMHCALGKTAELLRAKYGDGGPPGVINA